MATGAATIRDRAAAADGLTLVELLLAASLALVVLGGAVGLMTTGLKNEPRVAERSADIQGARVAMERLTRELRQGASVVSASSTGLSLVTNVKSATCGGAAAAEARACRVTYSCSAGQCTRTESNPDGSGGGPTELVITGISPGSVFSYLPSTFAPTHVGIRLEFPGADGEDSITLTDGVTLRTTVAPAS